MPQAADIGSKRLISLAPDAWVKWVTQRSEVEARDIVSSDFQWVSRESDVLVQAYSPGDGEFLVLNELQLRYSRRMPQRMRAYAALAEERYGLPVYPVLVNILPPTSSTVIADRYESTFMDVYACQEYKVVNLWTVDADIAFREGLRPLLPLVPVLKGGDEESVVRRAVQVLRTDEQLSEMEPLLAFFASFVLETRLIQQIMRWDMAVLRESPWYQEILEEGLEKGIEQGIEKGIEKGVEKGLAEGLREGAQMQLVGVLEHRFETVPAEVQARLRTLDVDQLRALVDVALDVSSLDEFLEHLPTAKDDGREAASAGSLDK